MKSTLSVAATLMMVSQTHALDDWEQLKQALGTFNLAKAAEHAQNVDWSEVMPELTNRHHSKEFLEGVKRRMTPLTKQQRHQSI